MQFDTCNLIHGNKHSNVYKYMHMSWYDTYEQIYVNRYNIDTHGRYVNKYHIYVYKLIHMNQCM